MKLTMIIADDELLSLKREEMRVKKEFPDIEIVATAEDGIEFKDLVSSLNPDLALVDIRMPGLTGIEAIELLRAKGCTTHFIVNTAYSDFEYVKSALDLKTDGYLLKPAKREEFVHTIGQICDTIRYEREKEKELSKINSAIEAVLPIIGNEILTSLFLDCVDEKNFTLYCDLNNISFSQGFILTFLPKAKDVRIPKKKVGKTISATLGNICNFLKKVTEENIIIMIFVPAEISEEDIDTWKNEIARLIEEKLQENHGISLWKGVGGIYNSFAKMKESYLESIRMFERDDVKGQIQIEKSNQYVKKACEYIALKFSEDVSLEECANYIGISSYYLSRIFRQIQGQTFIDYLVSFRMEEAKRLCRESDYSIKKIAEKCGYSNLTYFYKVFKKNTGYTMGQYMDKVRRSDDT